MIKEKVLQWLKEKKRKEKEKGKRKSLAMIKEKSFEKWLKKKFCND